MARPPTGLHGIVLLTLLRLSAALRAGSLQGHGKPRHTRKGNNTIYFMHIPRTAGTSFIVDSRKALKSLRNNLILKYELLEQEGCYDWHTEFLEPPKIAMMVRSPRSHVFSQYLMCGEGPISAMTSVPRVGSGGFAAWISSWSAVLAKGEGVGNFSRGIPKQLQLKNKVLVTATSLPFACYNPANMQAHRLTCYVPYNYPADIDVKRAVGNMQQAWFVGLTEAYQESVCLFSFKVYGKLPDFCNCMDKEKWSSFQSSRTSYHDGKFRTGPLSNQTNKVMDLVDNMTALDQILYNASLDRFEREVRGVEARSKVRILCKDLRQIQAKMYERRKEEEPPPQKPVELSPEEIKNKELKEREARQSWEAYSKSQLRRTSLDQLMGED